MGQKIYRKAFIAELLLFLFTLSACYSVQKKEYYSQTNNYINATGTIIHIAYSEDKDTLYLEFSDLTPSFDDTGFKIVGENLVIAQSNGIDEKLEIGDEIEFVTAPKYFGDGYVMPIVEISVAGEKLLEFEEGYSNLLKWLD